MIAPNDASAARRRLAPALLLLFLAFNLAKLLAFRQAIAMGGMNLPNFAFTVAVLGSLCLLCWPVLSRAGRGLLFWPAWALQAAYIFANLAYFTYYGTYLTISSAQALFSEAAGIAAAGGIPMNPRTFLVAFADLPLAIAAFAFRRGAAEALEKAPRALRLAALLALCGAAAFRAVDNPFLYTIGRAVFRPNVAVNAYGLLPYQLGSYLQNERGLASLVEAMEPRGQVRDFPGRPDRADIVVIQAESLGSDALGARVDGKPLMPYLERLSRECLFFPYTLVYHKGGGTSDTEIAVVSSTETLPNYPAANLPLDYLNSFVKDLKAAGYAAIAYHGNGADYFNRSRAFPAMGFDRYESLETMGIPSQGWGAPDHEFFPFVAASLRRTGSPSFHYAITMSSHGPYTNVPRYFSAPFPRGELSEIEYRYDTSLLYLDGELEKAVAAFRAAGAEYIFIFGDHPDYYVDRKDRSRERSVVGFDGATMKFTPLFIMGPGVKARREERKVASLLDLGPTVLAASGAPGSIRSYGENLLDPAGPRGPVVFGGREYDRGELFAAVAAVSGRPIGPASTP